jgi:hypothetical protein
MLGSGAILILTFGGVASQINRAVDCKGAMIKGNIYQTALKN